MTLNEEQLKLYIAEAISQELNEGLFDGTRRAQNGNSNQIANIKQKWGYEWNTGLTYEQNIQNLNYYKKKITDAGCKDFQEYMAKNSGNQGGGANNGNGTTPAQSDTTPAQPELKKYNPQEPAPFANVRSRVMQFQTWFNDNSKNGQYGAVEPLVVDGIWGVNTQKAWQLWLTSSGRALQ